MVGPVVVAQAHGGPDVGAPGSDVEGASGSVDAPGAVVDTPGMVDGPGVVVDAPGMVDEPGTVVDDGAMVVDVPVGEVDVDATVVVGVVDVVDLVGATDVVEVVDDVLVVVDVVVEGDVLVVVDVDGADVSGNVVDELVVVEVDGADVSGNVVDELVVVGSVVVESLVVVGSTTGGSVVDVLVVLDVEVLVDDVLDVDVLDVAVLDVDGGSPADGRTATACRGGRGASVVGAARTSWTGRVVVVVVEGGGVVTIGVVVVTICGTGSGSCRWPSLRPLAKAAATATPISTSTTPVERLTTVARSRHQSRWAVGSYSGQNSPSHESSGTGSSGGTAVDGSGGGHTIAYIPACRVDPGHRFSGSEIVRRCRAVIAADLRRAAVEDLGAARCH